MDVLVLGAGMMGRAIAYDLQTYSHFNKVTIVDKDEHTLTSARKLCKGKTIEMLRLDIDDNNAITKQFQSHDVAISAVPYRYNYTLAKIAVQTQTHFIDLCGNNDIVQKERGLFDRARKNNITIIPDSGLAPGLVSIITRDIVDQLDTVDSVKIRVGGLPQNPQPPLNYQIVFSPYGLINEYIEDAIILDHGKIIQKKSMTDVESIRFPKPFGLMEAFLTSGGCSTLPVTYKDTIRYLDYKTIRYPGHCEKIKTFLDLGFAEEKAINVKGQMIAPRDVFAHLLTRYVPTTGEDVVLLKVLGLGTKNGKKSSREYLLIDYYDRKHGITAMMRTTGYPVSITAQMIEDGTISDHGVFCPEEIIPPEPFFTELKKRNITLTIRKRSVSA